MLVFVFVRLLPARREEVLAFPVLLSPPLPNWSALGRPPSGSLSDPWLPLCVAVVTPCDRLVRVSTIPKADPRHPPPLEKLGRLFSNIVPVTVCTSVLNLLLAQLLYVLRQSL